MENPPPPWPPPTWAPPPPPPPPPAHGLAGYPGAPSSPPKGRGLVVLVVLALAVGAGVVLMRLERDDGPRWATTWDARVEPLARFVERERGLTFEHPVTVSFVPEQEFLAELRQRRADAAGSAADASSDAPDLPFERAFGLVPAAFEEARSTSDSAAGIVGAYDPWSREIRLRGVELTVAVRVTLVHELTHALQDQEFDLRRAQSEPDSNTGGLALLGVIEGDATLVERAYIDQLTDAEREELGAAEQDVVDAPELDRVPGALLSSSSLPYVLGPALVEAVELLGPGGARDDLFREPPASDLALLFPERHLAATATPAELDAPDLGDGEEAIDSGRYGDDVGAFAWLTVLAGRLDVHEAVTAIDGWAGDRIVTFRRSGATCARAAIGAVDAAAAAVLAGAFERWAAGGPIGSATVARSDRTLSVTSCDVGLGDPPTDERFDDPLLLLDVRNGALVVDDPFGRSDVTIDDRVCLGESFAADVTLAELRDLAAVSDERFDELGADAQAACGLAS